MEKKIISPISNFQSPTSKLIYFIGIKGAGMSALALIYKKLGADVLGSDVKEEFFSDKILKQTKIKILNGFKKENIPAKCDFIVCSNAYLKNENPEYVEALKRGYEILSYPEAVGALFNQCFGIAVAGSHGKTTTTAMVAEIIKEARLPLIALVGSEVLNWKSNAFIRIKNQELRIKDNFGKRNSSFIAHNSKEMVKPFFVLEADEYREAFLNYTPKILLITNIDWDHPDYFKKEIDYINAFKKLIQKTILNGGKIILSEDTLKTLGSSNYRGRTSIVGYDRRLKFNLKVAGEFNQYNANGAYKIAKELGVKESIIRSALLKFQGTRRRMEEHNIQHLTTNLQILIIDDYAHHPTEIAATLNVIKRRYKNKKIWVFFQPHTFSRTKAYFPQFVKALKLADKVSIVETFGSTREKKGFSAKNITSKIKGAVFHKTIDGAARFLLDFILNNQKIIKDYIIITMGAGDINKLVSDVRRRTKYNA